MKHSLNPFPGGVKIPDIWAPGGHVYVSQDIYDRWLVTSMKVGDEVEFKGQRGVVTWATSGIVDLTFDDMSPIAYEILAEKSMVVAKHYNSTKDVFTLDRKAPILRDLKLLGNANDADNKCCCGGDSIGATRHPTYCPKYKIV